MPERVHAKFGDEPLTSLASYAEDLQKIPEVHLTTDEAAKNPQECAPVSQEGLAQYVRELQKSSHGPFQKTERIQNEEVADIVQTQGIKRARDGSAKSQSNIKLKPDLSPSKECPVGEVKYNENASVVEAAEKIENSGHQTETADATQTKERLKIAPKLFYGNGNSQKFKFHSKLSGSVNNNTPRGDSDGGSTPQDTSWSSVDSPSTARRRKNSFGRSPAEPDDLRSTTTGHHPNQSSLIKIRKELSQVRKALPIWAHKADIRWALRYTDVLLLAGETGSGKSTQVPQFLTSESWSKKKVVNVKTSEGQTTQVHVGGMIAITEPRRVAAISLARRVAQETGSSLSRGESSDEDRVGYSVRFDTIVPRNTNIKFLTEGMLLQEMLHDPNLRKYSVVIIDEIHERSVNVDLLTGFLRNIVRGDKSGRGGVPLKLVIMSATANMYGLQKFFSTGATGSTEAAISIHDKNPGTKNGESPTRSDGADKNMELLDKGFNSVESVDTNVSYGRRVSNASFSSWDGIISDDDRSRWTNGVSAPSSSGLADENGFSHFSASDDNYEYAKPEHIDVAIHYIKGRQHPVKILYTPEPVADYVEATLKTVLQIHTKEPLPGDILAFLTGQEELETLQELIQQNAVCMNKALPKLAVLCLYGNQTVEQQQEAFATSRDKRTRKVVLATNVAETSITVPGVRFVIDCGKVKIKQHRARLGLQSLLVKPISKSSAIQRKGRAGREAPGKCYRLYTESEYLKLNEDDLPEILRSDVVEAVLQMKARGVQDVISFPLMNPPEIDAIERALLNLHSIGALNDHGDLSEIGKQMVNFPLPAAYSRVVVAAAALETNCLLEAVDIIAYLTAGEDGFSQPKSDEVQEKVENARSGLLRREGDLITCLTAMQQYASENSNRSTWCEERLISIRYMKQAMNIRKQLRDICLKRNLLIEKPPPDPQQFNPITTERAEVLLKCFMKAFATKTATLQPDGNYCTTIGRHLVTIHPSSVLYGKKIEAIMFLEQVFTQKNYAKKVSVIQMNWIAEALEET